MDCDSTASGGLFKHGREINLRKGEVLHRADECCTALGLVLDGEIGLSRVLSTGKELRVKTFRTSDLFAELIVFTGETYPGCLRALVPSRVVEVNLSRVMEHLSNPRALTSYFAGIAKKMSHMSDMIEVLSLRTVRQRIAFSILYGAPGGLQRNEPDDGRYRINISRFASSLDSSREAVSRALSGLESEGLLRRDGAHLVVRDGDALERIL